ncbi:MAG: HAMP domain-containing sensor histidine kinase [Elusimicrobiota bacterium]
MKLRTKISIFTLSIVVIVTLLISFSVFLYVKDLQFKNVREKQKEIFENFVEISKQAVIVHDELLLLNNMNTLQKTYEGICYLNYVTKKEDTTRTLYSNPDKSFRSKDVVDIKDRQNKTYKDRQDKDIFEISSPLLINGEKKGVCQIGFSEKVYKRELSKSIKEARNRIAGISVISVIAGLIISLLSSKKITQPIKKLILGAQSIGKGDLDTRIEINSDDEYGVLADEFNFMALKLKELDRAKDDFVNAVSHELKTPISAIEGYIDFLRESGKKISEEKKEKAFNVMKDCSRRLSKFINDVLDIARIKSSNMTIKKEKHDIKKIINKTVDLLISMAEKKDIRIDCNIKKNVPPVMVDEDRIIQVFTNIIGNAIKFTPNGGKITVKTGKQLNGFLEVSVKDTGQGMSDQELNEIFNQFVQAENSRKIGGPKGTGLGLAIAKGIIDSHGGRIWVESELDKGTTFFLTLPVAEKDEKLKEEKHG